LCLAAARTSYDSALGLDTYIISDNEVQCNLSVIQSDNENVFGKLKYHVE